ncbi:unnamed protein product, partial [Brassica rapa subsp. trilocularis]
NGHFPHRAYINPPPSSSKFHHSLQNIIQSIYSSLSSVKLANSIWEVLQLKYHATLFFFIVKLKVLSYILVW